MHPAHFLANLLDPRLCGKDLMFEQEKEAKKLLANLAVAKGFTKEVIFGELAAFRVRAGIFISDLTWSASKACHPAVWWRGSCKRSPLSEIAASLLEMPASTAPAERNWKSHKQQLTSKRNRLAVDQLTKLVSVAEYLKAKDIGENRNTRHFGMLSLLNQTKNPSAYSAADEWILNSFGLEDEAESEEKAE